MHKMIYGDRLCGMPDGHKGDHMSKEAYTKKQSNRDKNKDIERRWCERGIVGMTIKIRDEMLSTQLGVCAICGNPPIKSSRNLSVDHDHTTGKPRALLCQKCNHMLGNANDDPLLLRLAANYLEKFNKEN